MSSVYTYDKKHILYGIFNDMGVCVYIGITHDIDIRIEQHKYKMKSSLKPLYTWMRNNSWEFVILGTSSNAIDGEILEKNLIQKYELISPLYNIQKRAKKFEEDVSISHINKIELPTPIIELFRKTAHRNGRTLKKQIERELLATAERIKKNQAELDYEV